MLEICRRNSAESETQRLSCWILMGIMLRRFVLGKNDSYVGIIYYSASDGDTGQRTYMLPKQENNWSRLYFSSVNNQI